MPFWGPKWSICPEQLFWVKTINITFIYLLALFIVQNLKKILIVDPELWRYTIFETKMVHLPQTKFFLEKRIKIIFIYLLAPFIVQNLTLTVDPELWRSAIFGPKMTHLPNDKFFRKLVNKPCSFHSCLSTCQKLKSDIHLLMKYWRLKNTKISLTLRYF